MPERKINESPDLHIMYHLFGGQNLNKIEKYLKQIGGSAWGPWQPLGQLGAPTVVVGKPCYSHKIGGLQ
jgi:hypothetical protein